MTAPAPLRGARAALVFLTRVPVGGFPYSDAEFAWASGWFPAVGALLGLVLAGALRAFSPLGPPAAAVATLATSLLLTGAFHEDGLADSADALGGAFDRTRLFEILKDSRVGTYGACALCISLALRATLLVRLGPLGGAALVATEALSRCGPVWLMRALPYVTPDAAARSRVVARPRTAQVALATAVTVAVLALACVAGGLSPVRLAGAALVVALVAALAGRWFVRRAGGITGDFLGATQQAGVVAALAVLAANPS